MTTWTRMNGKLVRLAVLGPASEFPTKGEALTWLFTFSTAQAAELGSIGFASGNICYRSGPTRIDATSLWKAMGNVI